MAKVVSAAVAVAVAAGSGPVIGAATAAAGGDGRSAAAQATQLAQDDRAGAAGGDGLGEYSFVPGRTPKAHRAVLKVTVRGLPKGVRARVSVQRRTGDFGKTTKRGGARVMAKIASGAKHLFRYERSGHYLVRGAPVRVGADRYEAHAARVVVSKSHGVHAKVRYYHPDHEHHPLPGVNAPERGTVGVPLPEQPPVPGPTTAPSAGGSGPGSGGGSGGDAGEGVAAPDKPSVAFPITGRGSSRAGDPGQGQWPKCLLTWSFDPGPTLRYDKDPHFEMELLRGVFESMEKLTDYRFAEVNNGGDIKIIVADHLPAFQGVTPSGLTTVTPGAGDFKHALVRLNAHSLFHSDYVRTAEVRQNLYGHEIGHAVGLNHVGDADEIMAPTVPLEHGWASGDAGALREKKTTCS